MSSSRAKRTMSLVPWPGGLSSTDSFMITRPINLAATSKSTPACSSKIAT